MAAVVIHHGSGITKVGVARENTPKVTFSTVVGTATDDNSTYVGSKAHEKKDTLTLTYPIERGQVKNWDDLEKIWHHAYDELKLSPSEQPVLLTEAPLMPAAERQKIVQIMFEKFNVPSMSLGVDSVLALYAAGRMDGVVLDSGCGVTYAVPCAKGFAIPNSIIRVDFGGNDLTDYLTRLLKARGHSLSTDTIEDIKKKLCYVAKTYQGELQAAESLGTVDRGYKLPDGSTITVGSERFKCPEALFNPELAGIKSAGIHQLIFDAVMQSDPALHKDMFSNIVVAGGNTMFQGLADRLENELKKLVPQGTDVKIVAPPEREHSVWIGGSILAALPNFKDVLITKEAYAEKGPSIADRIE